MTGKEAKYELQTAIMAKMAYPKEEALIDDWDAWKHRMRVMETFRVTEGNATVLLCYKKRDLHVSFAGTNDPMDILSDLRVDKVYNEYFGMVHEGFEEEAMSIFKTVDSYVDRGHRIHVAGHSLGGAMAILYWVWLMRRHNSVPYRGRSYGQPRVGGPSFNAIVDVQMQMHRGKTEFLQWANNQDAVSQAPRANWFDVYRAYKNPVSANIELLYKHPDSVGKLWLDRRGKVCTSKPFSFNPIGSIRDHIFDRYIDKFQRIHDKIVEDYVRSREEYNG